MKNLIACLLLMGVVFATSGCMGMKTNRQPRYEVPAPLEIQPFKRRTLHDSVDFIHVWSQQAYSPVDKPITRRLTLSQHGILERHGQPNWVRRSFKATTGEKVSEWAWWDRSIIAQFVQGELVFEGELTDMDRYRIRYGYPRRAWAQKYEAGVQRDLWEYQGIYLDNNGMIVTFSDEELVSVQRF